MYGNWEAQLRDWQHIGFKLFQHTPNRGTTRQRLFADMGSATSEEFSYEEATAPSLSSPTMTIPSKQLLERLYNKRRTMTPKEWDAWVEQHLPAPEVQMLSEAARKADVEEGRAGGRPSQGVIYLDQPIHSGAVEAVENLVKFLRTWMRGRRSR